MDRIERLERWWYIYKIKQTLKKAAFFAAALFAGAGAVYYVNNVNGLNTAERPPDSARSAARDGDNAEREAIAARIMEEARTPIEVTVAQPRIPNAAIEPILPVLPEKQEKPDDRLFISGNREKTNISITPSFTFESDLNRRVEKTAANFLRDDILPPPPRSQQNPLPPRSNSPAQNGGGEAAIAQSAPRTSGMVIQKVVSVADLESAFNRQPSYPKAVDIAGEYLKKGNAQAAYDWAMKANEINDRDEQSWAIFAVSSYKIGNKERAIIALRAYLSQRPSEKLTKLLRQIEADEPNAGGDI